MRKLRNYLYLKRVWILLNLTVCIIMFGVRGSLSLSCSPQVEEWCSPTCHRKFIQIFDKHFIWSRIKLESSLYNAKLPSYIDVLNELKMISACDIFKAEMLIIVIQNYVKRKLVTDVKILNSDYVFQLYFNAEKQTKIKTVRPPC